MKHACYIPESVTVIHMWGFSYLALQWLCFLKESMSIFNCMMACRMNIRYILVTPVSNNSTGHCRCLFTGLVFFLLVFAVRSIS